MCDVTACTQREDRVKVKWSGGPWALAEHGGIVSRAVPTHDQAASPNTTARYGSRRAIVLAKVSLMAA